MQIYKHKSQKQNIEEKKQGTMAFVMLQKHRILLNPGRMEYQ